MKKKGFTLVELLMVVIIIGILVTLAVPNYYRSIERAKAGKAKAAMDAIRKGELQYRAFNDTYSDDLADLEAYDLPKDLWDNASDGDWTYTITTFTASELVIDSAREAGPNSGATLTMDQDGQIINVDAVLEWGA